MRLVADRNGCDRANPPAPFPSRTETLSELMFAVATSSLPSRLKSAVEIEWGSWPTGNGDPAEGMNDGPDGPGTAGESGRGNAADRRQHGRPQPRSS